MKKYFLKCASLGLALTVFTACKKVSFGGNTPGATPTANAPTANQNSPQEVDESLKKQLCADKHKAIRLAFVVDNSLSNGTGEEQSGTMVNGSLQFIGSDPIVKRMTARGKEEPSTVRQNAIYEAILHTIHQDQAGVKANPEFVGSATGISYFPNGDKAEFVMVSGQGVLPKRLTELKGVSADPSFQNGLWDALAFTHKPMGNTPYVAALQSAKSMLTEKAPNDARNNIVVIVSDGLPTDEQPSKVKKAREDLGAGSKVILLSLLRPGQNVDSQNSEPKEALKKAFLDPNNAWGRREGSTDGYGSSEAEFERYWKDLRDLPKQISDHYVEIDGPANLKPELDKVLKDAQTCL